MADVVRGHDPTLILRARGLHVAWAATLGRDAIWVEEENLIVMHAELTARELPEVVAAIVEMVSAK